jgi:mycothiol synthase
VRERQLLMKRRDLEGMRKQAIPKGYSMRTYREGDEKHWARIISGAFGTECSADVFGREIAEHEAFRGERVFFLTHKGKPVGTATAWIKPELGPLCGYVHMVAIVPEHTRKGLGKVLTGAVLAYFKKEGFGSAFLHTDEHRLAAIKTYLDMGFEPVIRDEGVRRRWLEVFRALRRPELAHRYCGEE